MKRMLPLSLALLAIGCSRAIGPRAMVRDRAQYSESLSDSWKDQTLLNIVKLRYLDPPAFVDIGSIVASYSLQQNASVGGTIESTIGSPVFGVSGTLSNNPTITYTPLSGSKFIKSVMTPIPPQAIFFSIESGTPADAILLATVDSINGLRNQDPTFEGIVPADSGFHRMRSLVRKIQMAGAVRIYAKEEADKQTTNLLTLRSEEVSPDTLADIKELRHLLRLNPDATEFRLVLGPFASKDTEIAVMSRSILSLMKIMAAQVEVPDEDLTQHLAFPGFEQGRDQKGIVRLIHIQSSKTKPSKSFVTVYYRGSYFWIDDGDLESKQMFSLIMIFFTLADSGEKENLPLITIPTR